MSNLSLERLLFDPSEIDVGPVVGSYLIGASGEVVDTTDVSGTEGLNVNILNELGVDVDGIYNAGTNPNPDNVGLIAHTRAAALTAAEQVERTTAGLANADGVVAANVKGLDVNSFLMGFNGTTWDRLLSVDGALEVNISSLTEALEVVGNVADDAVCEGNPVLFGGQAYDQATSLSALSAAGDRGHALMDLYRRIYINDAPNRAIASVNKQVTDEASAIVAASLAGRTRVLIQNVGNDPLYIGPSGVTVGTGLLISKGATLALEAGQALAFFAITATGKTTNIRVFELA